jgi:methyltransferase-like protein
MKPLRKEGFVVRTFGSEAVLVPVASRIVELNALLALNETALHIWNQLDGSKSLADIAKSLTQEFDVDEETARRDTEELVAELVRIGVVEDVDAEV